MKKLKYLILVLLLTSCSSSSNVFTSTYKYFYHNDFNMKYMDQIIYSPSPVSSYIGIVDTLGLKHYLNEKLTYLYYTKVENDDFYIKDGSIFGYAYIVCIIDNNNSIQFNFNDTKLYAGIIKEKKVVAAFSSSLPDGWKHDVQNCLSNALNPKPY